MQRWSVLVVALMLVMAVGSSAYAQTPGGSSDKMDKDKMGDAMGKDKMMDKDKMGDAMGKDKMMDKKQ